MASEYRIHKPYVLATLPRPLDHTAGNIVAQEVYSQRDGQRRKRTELAVGIDGEAVSIYDVPGSRLITSYPIPPQESFTCPPHSLRVRRSGSTDVARYTFIATKDAVSHKLTLFKDVVHQQDDGKTTSTTEQRSLRSSPVRYITTSSTSQTSVVGDVIVVCQAGEVISLSGETLAIKWTSPSKSVVQEAMPSALEQFDVDFVVSGSVADFREGIFKNEPDIYAALPKKTTAEPTILGLIARSVSQGVTSQYLAVLAVAPDGSTAEAQRLIPLHITPIPSGNLADKTDGYHIDTQNGTLLQLQRGALIVHDLTGAVPKLKSVIQIGDAVAFSRLSRPFVLSCSTDSLGLYNYKYRSLHAKAPLDLSGLPLENQSAQSCRPVGYLRSQDLVVALIDNVLACIHVEPPSRGGKRRKDGMLIDSIGRGTQAEIPTKRVKRGTGSNALWRMAPVPGTITESYLAQFQAEVEALDGLLSNNEIVEWEERMRKNLQMGQRSPDDASSDPAASDNDAGYMTMAPEWDWPLEPSAYPAVDRRWIIYAISRIFTTEMITGEQPRLGLRLMISDCQVTTYLALAGHLTISNVKSAFQEELEANPVDTKMLKRDLTTLLVATDDTMTLFLNYLRATKLGGAELVFAVRELMLRMGLIPVSAKEAGTTMNLLAGGDGQPSNKDDMELDDLQRKIEATERHLGDESSTSSMGLTLALSKLHRLPTRTVVKALRATLSTEEIISLMQLLRVELVQGGWTSLYVGQTGFDVEGNEPPPDNAISLIAGLLSRCVDAVGIGGWLLNDATAGSGGSESEGFLKALKLQVTAALEGVEEAAYLKNMLGELIRYSEIVQGQPSSTSKPMAIEGGPESRMLPLGLKPPKQIPGSDKEISGGEVVARSVRETQHLDNSAVPEYSIERLNV